MVFFQISNSFEDLYLRGGQVDALALMECLNVVANDLGIGLRALRHLSQTEKEPNLFEIEFT